MPPNLLTPHEFAQTPAAQKPGASYETYKAFVVNTRARRAAARLAAAPDTLAPTPEATLSAQAGAAVHAQIDPLIKEIMASTRRQAAQVGGLTGTYAARLAPFEAAAKDRYAGAAAGSAAVATSLADRMQGAGASEGESLAAKLRAINAPGALVENIAGGATDFGRNAGNAGYSTDASALQELIANGATAQDYAGSLPGLARLEGQRAQGQVRGEGQSQIGDIRAKVPGLVSDLLTSARDRELNKAIALRGFGEKAAAAKTAAQVAADKAAQAWTKIQQAGERLKLQAGNASFNQGVSAARLSLSQKQYQLALQKEARLAKGKSKGGFTAAAKQHLSEVAFDSAQVAFQGFYIADGKGSYLDRNGKTVTYAKGDQVKLAKSPVDLLRDLIGRGIPFSIAVKAIQRFAKDPTASAEWQATLGWTK